MKRALILTAVVIAAVLVGLQMKPTYHLYGMKITLDGDLEEAARRAHLAQKLMFQTKLLNVNNLDIIQNNLRLSDGTHVYVLSQHGLDSATIYVPPKPAVPVPGKRRWVEQFIWPALWITSNAWSSHERDFKGVVLCKGGGFEPPYEFIPKEMLPGEILPADFLSSFVDAPKSERIWYDVKTAPNIVERQFEDLCPDGIATPAICQNEAPKGSNSESASGSAYLVNAYATTRYRSDLYPPYQSVFAMSEWEEYNAVAAQEYWANQSIDYFANFQVGFYYSEDGHPGYEYFDYPASASLYPYIPARMPKMPHVLNLSLNRPLRYSVAGQREGNWIHGLPRHAYDDGIILIDDMFHVDQGASLQKVINEAMSEAAQYVNVPTMEFWSSTYVGHNGFVNQSEDRNSAIVRAGIADADNFVAVVNYIDDHKHFYRTYTCPGYACTCEYISNPYHNWTCRPEIVEDFDAPGSVLAPECEIYLNNQLRGVVQGQYPTLYVGSKYFTGVREGGIGLLAMNTMIVADVESYFYEYSYVYVDQDSFIQTFLGDPSTPLPPIPGDNGETLYHAMSTRLIRETVTYEEDL